MPTSNKKPIRVSPLVDGLDLRDPDPRDFSLSGVFGAIDVSIIPNEEYLAAGPIRIKNQHASDMCTGFGLAAVREAQEQVELSPEWLFAQIKKIRGDLNGYGGDLNSGIKVALKVGAIEQKDAPFTIDSKDRNFLANWHNWPATLNGLGTAHLAESSFRVDGPYDTFDNIRAALWANRGELRAVYTGCLWRPSWLSAQGGVIPDEVEGGGVGHCFCILPGQKIINGQPYLFIQNSAGAGVGDGGVYYMSRAVANRELKFGCYMFKDMPRDVAEHLNGQFTDKQNQAGTITGFFKELFALMKRHANA